MEKRVLGLDIGLKRTGVSISDETLLIASPLTVIEASGKKDWLAKILGVVEQEDVGKIVVGLPLNHHGEAGKDAETIGKFIALLREHAKLPVIEWDERFTTVQAERSLLEADLSRKKRKQVIDKVAASITLQAYLDSLRFHAQQSLEDGWETDLN